MSRGTGGIFCEILNMDCQGQYYQKPPKKRRDTLHPLRETKPPELWESFMGGFKANKLNYEQWADLRLAPREWLQKYKHLGLNYRDYQRWKRSLPEKKRNWLQRLLHPSKRRI